MVKAKLGVKRTCLSCSMRFYDFKRKPIICPGCGVEFDPNNLLKRSQKSRRRTHCKPLLLRQRRCPFRRKRRQKQASRTWSLLLSSAWSVSSSTQILPMSVPFYLTYLVLSPAWARSATTARPLLSSFITNRERRMTSERRRRMRNSCFK